MLDSYKMIDQVLLSYRAKRGEIKLSDLGVGESTLERRQRYFDRS